MTLTELPEQDLMNRQLNRGLMVAFINRDPANRAHLDVRKSIVLYDANGGFLYALPDMPDENAQAALKAQTGVTYWSKGI